VSVSAPVRRAYLDVSGRQVHYRTAGRQGLPRLLLLHQSPSSSAMYQALMQLLADRYQVFAPDTPGFGNSDPLPVAQHALQIADYASAIHGFCDALGLDGCYVFGHHTGAAVAVQLEHDYPGTAQAMALSGPTLLSDEQKIALPQLAGPLPADARGSHVQALWQRLRDKDPEAPLPLTQRELLSALACGASYQASYQAVTRQDFANQLPAIACPVLVFAGDEDPLYAAVEPTLALLQNGYTVSLSGGERTYVCERQADTVAAVLHNFFDESGS